LQKQESALETVKKDKDGLEKDVVELNKVKTARDELNGQLMAAQQKTKEDQRNADMKMNNLMAEWKKVEKKKDDDLNKEKDKVVDLSAKLDELGAIKKKNADLDGKLNKVNNQLAELEINNKKAIAKKVEECHTIQSKLEEQSIQVKHLKEDMADQVSNLENAKAEVKALEKTKTELEKLQNELQKTKAELEKKSASNAEIEKKAGQLEVMEKQLAVKESELTKLQDKMAEIGNEKELSASKLAKAEVGLAEAEKEKNKLEKELEAKIDELNTVKSQDSDFEKQLTEKDMELSKLQEKMVGIDNEKEESAIKLAKAEAGLVEAETDKAKLNEELEAKIGELSTVKLQDSDFEKQLTEKDLELSKLHEKTVAFENEKEESANKLARAEASLAEAEQDKRKLEEKLEAKIGELNTNKLQDTHLKLQVTEKDSELSKFQEKMAYLDNEKKESANKLAQAEADLAEADKEKEKLHEELKTKINDLNAVMSKNSELEQKESELASLRHQLEGLPDMTSALEEKILEFGQLQGQVDDLASKIVSLEDTQAKASKQAAQYKQKLEQSELEIQELRSVDLESKVREAREGLERKVSSIEDAKRVAEDKVIAYKKEVTSMTAALAEAKDAAFVVEWEQGKVLEEKSGLELKLEEVTKERNDLEETYKDLAKISFEMEGRIDALQAENLVITSVKDSIMATAHKGKTNLEQAFESLSTEQDLRKNLEQQLSDLKDNMNSDKYQLIMANLATAEREVDRQELSRELDLMRSERTALQDSEEEYEQMLEISTSVITVLQDEVRKEKELMEECQRSNVLLQERFVQIASDLNNAQYDITMMKVEGVDGDSERASLLKTVKGLETEKAVLDKARKELKKQLMASQTVVNNLCEEVSAEHKTIEKLGLKTKSAEDKIVEMERELSDAKYESIMTSVSLVDAHNLSEQVSCLKKTNDALKNDLVIMSGRCDCLQSENFSLQSQLANGNDNFAHLLQQVNDLRTEKLSLADNESSLNEELRHSKSTIAALTSEVSQEKAFVSLLTSDKIDLSNRLSKMELDLSQATYDALMSSVGRVDAEGATREFAGLKRSNEDLRRNLDSVSTRCKQLTFENADLRDKFSVDAANNRQKTAYFQSRIQEAEDRLTESEKIHRMALDNRLEEISGLQQMNNEQADDLESHRNGLDNKFEEICALLRLSDKQAEKLDELKGEMAKVRESDNAMRAEKAEIKAQLDVARQEIEKLMTHEKEATETKALKDSVQQIKIELEASTERERVLEVELQVTTEKQREGQHLYEELSHKLAAEAEKAELGSLELSMVKSELSEAQDLAHQAQAAHQASVKSKEAEAEGLRMEKEQLAAELDKLRLSSKDAASRIQEAEARLTESEKIHMMALDNKFEEISGLQQMNGEQADDLVSHRNGLENKVEEICALLKLSDKQAEKLDKLKGEMTKVRESDNEMRAEKAEIKAQLDVARQEIEMLMAQEKEATETLKDSVQQIKIELEASTERGRVLEFELQVTTEKQREGQHQYEELSHKLVAEAEKAELGSLELSMLRSELSEAQDLAHQAQTAHQASMKGKEAEAEGLRMEKEQLAAELNELRLSSEDAASRTSNVNQELATMKKNFEAAQRAKNVKLKDTLSEMDELKGVYAEQKDTLDTIMAEHEAMSQELQDANGDYKTAKKNIDQLMETNASLKKKVEEFKETEERLESDLAVATEARTMLQVEIENKTDQLEQLEEEVNALKERQDSSATLKTANLDLESKLEEALKTKSDLQKEIDEKETELISFGERIQDLIADLDEANDKASAISFDKVTMEDKMTMLTEESESSLKSMEEEKEKSSVALKKCTELEKQSAAMKKSKESFQCKTQMLLTSLKQKEKELLSLSKENDSLAADNASLKSDSLDLDEKTIELEECKKLIVQLKEAEKKFEESGPMPWETDEDLHDLKPLEILDCMADELSFVHKAKLHEMCIEEMKDELKTKTQQYIELLDDYSATKKELDRANLKMKCDASQTDKKASSTAAAANGQRMTRAKSQQGLAVSPPQQSVAMKKTEIDENVEASKKRFLSPEKRVHLMDKRTRIRSPKVSVPLGPRSNRTTAAKLQKDGPENPFAAKKAVIKPAKLVRF
jgi:chromosome segregation ATPase